MKDLTLFFNQANNQNLLDYQKSVFQIAISNNYLIDWDQECGENWGRILDDSSVICYFYAHKRIVLVLAKYNSFFKTLENDNTVLMLQVEDFDAPLFFIEPEKLTNGFQWNTEISPQSISINDLWFGTV
jgi:hypothetical protein